MKAAAQVPHDPPLVVIGTSAGGVEALVKIVGGLDDSLGAAVVVVLHLPATGTSVLPDILRRSGRLPASAAVDGHPLVPNALRLVGELAHVPDPEPVAVTGNPHPVDPPEGVENMPGAVVSAS